MRVKFEKKPFFIFRFRVGGKSNFFSTRMNRGLAILLLALLIITTALSISVIEQKIKPYVKTIAEARATYIATLAINEAISKKMADENINYSSLITVDKNNSGMVTALHADTAKMNSLKAELALLIQDRIVSIDSSQVSIPVGNLVNGELFSGLGPRIKIRLVPVGLVSVNFKNGFSGAGINQTRHQIYIDVAAKVSVLLPTISASSVVTTTVPVAETVIVGAVPETYTNVEGLGSADNIFDIINE